METTASSKVAINSFNSPTRPLGFRVKSDDLIVIGIESQPWGTRAWATLQQCSRTGGAPRVGLSGIQLKGLATQSRFQTSRCDGKNISHLEQVRGGTGRPLQS